MTGRLRARWHDLHRVDPDQLAADAADAATVRAHQTRPDVIALQVARRRDLLDRVMWLGIVCGLLWTAANVQAWVADGAPVDTVLWWTAWLTTAPVEVTLVAILLGEQDAARHGQRSTPVVRGARFGLLGIMGVLNVWHPAALLADGDPATGSVGMLVAHIAVPAAIVLASEAVTGLRDILGGAITSAAERAAAERADERARERDEARQRRDARRERRERDERADEPDTPPAGLPAGHTTRSLGVAWALAERDRTGLFPAPKAIHDGVLRDHGVDVSQGESSRIGKAAREQYLAHGTDDEGEQTG